MLQSMTGYGDATLNFKQGVIKFEIKSLNSKVLDLNYHLGIEYLSIENELRDILSKNLNRGKINLKLNVEYSKKLFKSNLNHDIIKLHINDLKQISSLSRAELLKIAIKLPNSISEDKMMLSKHIKVQIFKTIKKAIKELVNYRIVEGESMKKDIIKNLKIINKKHLEIKEFLPDRIKKIKQNLINNLKNINIDKNDERFEKELIYYLEKIDINEEIVRLENHIKYFLKIVQNSHNVKGKKLTFISQEIGREINTIGSKANFFKIQQKVVEMKDLLEKIKEQLLNVL